MIDTLKFLVPIDDVQLLKKLKLKFKQLIKHDPQTKIIDFEYYTLNLELSSHKGNVSIKISDTNPLGIFIELSISKYEKGNNVEMTYPSNLTKILEKLHTEIYPYIDYTLPHPSTWVIFRKNDFKKITTIDTDRAIDLIPWADKIVRFEVTFRRNYLRKLFNKETEEDVFIDRITDDAIEKLLCHYLNDNVFRYITLKNKTDAQLEEAIYGKFSKIKATRLYQFFRDFYLEGGAVKSRMLAGGLNRVTIYRYKKDLKSIGIGFNIPDVTGTSLLEQLVIPSGNSKFELVDSPEEDTAVSGKEEVV